MMVFLCGVPMLLMIDNYDSFTYNIVQYFEVMGEEVRVYKNDEITISQLEKIDPQYIVVSPGPCSPNEAGISMAVIKHFMGKIPLLGICLGHQCIGQVFGGNVVRAQKVMHGKVSNILHNNAGIFRSLPNPLRVTRYHSLVVDIESLPECLEVTAWSDVGSQCKKIEVMGLRHRQFCIEGVQFHPESIMTQAGYALLENFLEMLRIPH